MTAPNVLQLHGLGVSVSYSTGAGGSLPSLTYQDALQSHVFKGDEIRTLPSEIGALVTVTLRLTVDSGSTTFTLLVPTVNLTGPFNHVQIHTVGITTVHRFSLVPQLNHGQTELYSVVPLQGSAALIPF